MIKTPSTTMIGGAGIWTSGCTVIGSMQKTLDQLIKSLFSNNAVGFAYDPNDLTTLYQDAAGTIPVTAAGQPVGLVLDKSKGMAFGPELLEDTSFNNPSYWILAGTGISVANGNLNFNVATSASSARREAVTVLGRVYAVRLKVESITGVLRVGVSQGTNHSLTKDITTAGEHFIILRADGDLANFYIRCVGSEGTTAVVSEASLKEIQGNHAYQTVSASRPVLQRNATTGAYYLEFDGVDDFLQTKSIDFTSTDKVSLFAGVRKLSDAATGMLVELSATSVYDGTFYLYQTTGNRYQFLSRGTLTAVVSYAVNPAPMSSVLTGIGGISVDTAKLRINGVQVSSLNTDQGTGNYGNYPLYIGRRGGTSLPFNGHLYSLIGIGRLTTDSETITLEKSIAKNTGVTL